MIDEKIVENILFEVERHLFVLGEELPSISCNADAALRVQLLVGFIAGVREVMQLRKEDDSPVV